MSKRFFGTDGIRGIANEDLTPELVLRIGQALGNAFESEDDRKHTVVIGKDPRLSSYMIEYALAAALTSVGWDVILLGPMPTASVAMLTRETRADLGIMITASHNKFEDNGIKIFKPDGTKLSDEVEREIERMIDPSYKIQRAAPEALGRGRKDEMNRAKYVQFAKMTVQGLSLEGMRIVVDCANGAAYRSAPEALVELGAEVIKIGCEPDGFNINQGCGSTAPKALRDKVPEMRANVGIAFDGDADRVMFVDEQGKEIDGDQIIALLASRWSKEGFLAHSTVVGTVMTNIGLERYLQGLDTPLMLVRTPVGDHHILECMRNEGYNLGGEPSGHVILRAPQFPQCGTIADGLVTALHVLVILAKEGDKASQLLHCFRPVPQVSLDISVKDGKKLLADPRVQKAREEAEQMLGQSGRLVLRASGTEPVIRIMAEYEDRSVASKLVDSIADAIRSAKE